VFGSIGISLSTAQITQRSQVHQTYLSQWASPFHQPYQALIATYEQALHSMGLVGAAAHDAAIGRVYQAFRLQVTVLAYADVFYYCALVAFMVVPFCFFLSPKTGGGAPGAAH
jgi:MFS transporter, DHA2 family, multidrug resistance protein